MQKEDVFYGTLRQQKDYNKPGREKKMKKKKTYRRNKKVDHVEERHDKKRRRKRRLRGRQGRELYTRSRSAHAFRPAATACPPSFVSYDDDDDDDG